jgi:predicted NBD/HSP70 family sugar kinase
LTIRQKSNLPFFCLGQKVIFICKQSTKMVFMNNIAVRGSNHAGMREFNERIVLQGVRQSGALPKADLARLTQLSTQTVAIIVDRLITDGLVLKHARIRGKIGQPSVPIALNPDGALSVGIHVGRRGLEMLVCDFVGDTRHTWSFVYDYPDPGVVLAKVKEGLIALESAMGERWGKVVGIGLTAPLSLHQWVNVLANPSTAAAQALAQWQHINLQQAVQALTALPVEFAKDTTAACVAELLQGHGQRIRSFLYVFVGTFVGGGLVMGGHIVNGQRGNAGAIGSLPMGLGHAGEKPKQLLEIASGWQLEQALQAANLDPLLVHNDAIINSEYQAFTAPWLRGASAALAMTAASAAAFNDLDAVVIDGSLGRGLMDALITQTQAAMSQYHFEGMNAPGVLCGEVGKQARAKGGAWLPMHAQFFPDKEVFLKQDA